GNSDIRLMQDGEFNVIEGIGWNTLYYNGDDAEQFTINQEGEGNVVEGVAGHINKANRLDLNIQQMGESNTIQFNTQGADNKININRNGMSNSAVVNQSL
ncbi:MAG TPA: hypothetical protein VJ876_00315, partial [Bacteroidales bacterium]|nr:hypothetical protein [Bacteroidales bacterium]